MADLSPEETKQYFGRTYNAADVEADRLRAQQDPFGYALSLLTGDKSTIGGNAVSSGGGGFNPSRTGNEAAGLAGGLQLAHDVRNAPALNSMFEQGALAPDRANPYNTGVADQSRAAQLALIQQMRGQMNGPSIANMQGQRAMGAMGQQALMQGGRAGMLGAQGGAGGLAGDVGQARLAEVMRSQAGMGGAAGNLRGGDLRSADAQMQAGLQQRAQDDALRRFYMSGGMQLQNARDQSAANREITRLQLLAQGNARDAGAWTNFANQAASTFSGAVNAGGGSGGPAPTHGPSTGSH
jgi:hypothetical protein